MARLESEIGGLLVKKKKTLAIAESCTGGLLAHSITNAPGSSRYFLLGVVTYSNGVKASLLKIPRRTIIDHGAVSSMVARLMAKSVRCLGRADFGIGISGIAGPSGGSKAKPVGTVFIAVDSSDKKICKKFYFPGKRLAVKRKSVLEAERLLKQCLEID